MRRSGAETSAAVPSIPGVVDLSLIGSGGSGIIYRGRQEALSRDVAVKVLAAPPVTTASLTRWERELDAMGRLSNHPNIVTVYDSGLTDDGRPYLVMPFVPGGSLGDRVRSSGPLGVDEAVPLGVKIASALTAAHEAGVLHRDVKPDNVLLSPYEPQLADFGIARLVDSTATAVTTAGMIHATINYAAPEVLTGEPATEASDVYGLAATLYTALTGDVPYPHARDANAIAVAQRIVHEPVPALGAGVPVEVADVIQQGMAKDPGDRPRSAAAFGAALGSALRTPPDESTVPVNVDAHTQQTTVRADPIRTVADRRPAVRPRTQQSEPRRDRRAWMAVGAVIALVAAVLLLARLSDDTRTSTSAPPSTDAPTASTSRGQAAPTGGAAAETARRYFTLLSRGDYGGAYAMLSPEFRSVQSQESYESFWRSASPVSIAGEITARGLTASVPIRMGPRSSTYTLSLARGAGNTLYVDGPRPR